MLITSGRADVFALALTDGAPGGRRRPLCQVTAGGLILGMPPGGNYAVIAVAQRDTAIAELEWDEIAPHHAEKSALIDGWIAQIAAAAFGDIPTWPEYAAEPGQTIGTPDGQVALRSPHRGMGKAPRRPDDGWRSFAGRAGDGANRRRFGGFCRKRLLGRGARHVDGASRRQARPRRVPRTRCMRRSAISLPGSRPKTSGGSMAARGRRTAQPATRAGRACRRRRRSAPATIDRHRPRSRRGGAGRGCRSTGGIELTRLPAIYRRVQNRVGALLPGSTMSGSDR